MEPSSPVRDSYFEALAASRPGTAACVFPLVMWQDTVAPGKMASAYRHHDFFSLYVVRRGRGTHVIDGVPTAVARGDVYAMGPGQAHWFTDCHGLTLDTLHFAASVFDEPTREALATMPGFRALFVDGPLRHGEALGGRWLHLTPERHSAVSEALGELRSEWEAGTPEGALLARALFLRLLVHLARAQAQAGGMPPTTADATHAATVAAAVRYLDRHFTAPLRIADVAARMFLSPDRFTEVFSGAMGRTPRDYLGHLRLERAKRLLATTDLPIAEVGLESGFGDAAYFTRAFRAATGLTPRAFRTGKDL
jgi:AraC-like DNA-binding protein